MCMKKFFIAALLYLNSGCAMIFSSVGLEVSSTLLSLGSVGQTLITMTASDRSAPPVGPVPAQYSDNPDRMIREAWEQNYQLAKKAVWEGEDIPWNELVSWTARKSKDVPALFALVEKRALRNENHREDVTVYKTVSGRTLQDPSQSPGEAFYPQTQTRTTAVPVFLYTAWFFTGSRQPSGILAFEDTWKDPCGTGRADGTLVRATGKNTPADKAGLRGGDVITAINGHTADPAAVFSLLRPGANTLSICRAGQAGTTTLTLPDPWRK